MKIQGVKQALAIAMLALLVVPQNVRAEGDDADPVLNAISDEMKRTMSDLHPNHGQKPFYLGYAVQDDEELKISSSLGSLTKDCHTGRARILTTDLRVGDYDIDSVSGNQTASPPYRTELTVDNDYWGLRREAWLAADTAYSAAVKGLESKKSWLKSHYIKDRLPDFSREKPIVSLGTIEHLKIDDEKWQEKMRHLSAIFKKYPDIEESIVSMTARVSTRWIVNSEGTRIRESVPECLLFTGAETEPKAGSRFWDCRTLFSKHDGSLPPDSELEKWVTDFADHCVAVANAPAVDDYSGPVLFEGQAGASFFSNLLGGNLGSCNFRSGDSGEHAQVSWNLLMNAAGRRIMPKYLSVIDDPTLVNSTGKDYAGGWNFDDEGVVGQKMTLVDHGVLKAFATSRLPIKNQPQSNGHSFLGVGTNSIMTVESTKTFDAAALRKKLLELGEDDGLDYVLVARALYSPSDIDDNPDPFNPDKTPDDNFTQGFLEAPTDLYKVYLNDGHEELVKSPTIKSYDARRILKDIVAVGDDAAPYLVQRYDVHKPMHIIAPSVLVREIDIEKDARNNVKPRVIKSPILEANEETAP